MKPLDPPHVIEDDPRATELLRLWAANGKLTVAMNVGCWHEQGHDEARAWGVVAADFAKHVARALSQRYGESQADVIEEFRAAFLAELNDWTSDVSGE
ncbi:MAG: hypothetical protein CMJ58_22160 [Planctomycetaceae bacterium]|nr:hypothetical protein [Planctomycetaceae bacterium]